MKVIAGIWKGASLKTPPRHLARPTQARVKKSLFDTLGARIAGCRVLDLFAGAGSLGIEALSRGASSAVFVESHPHCMKQLRENVRKLKGAEKAALFFQGDAFRAIKRCSGRGMKFGGVFIDPPYLKGVTIKCLRSLEACAILTPNAFLAVRHAKEEPLPDRIGRLRCRQKKRYGDTVVSFYEGPSPDRRFPAAEKEEAHAHVSSGLSRKF